MAEQQVPDAPRSIAPKDVFERCNMPSRWERITNVAPKIDDDRKYLAFLAARHLDEERLPDPAVLVPPDELRTREQVGIGVAWGCSLAIFLMTIALAVGTLALAVAGGLIGVASLAIMIAIWMNTAGAINGFALLRSECEKAQLRLESESLQPRYRTALDRMITCDEGTLAYCAAKIASEIHRDPGWGNARAELIAIDLFDEIAEIACSAKQITDERTDTECLERSRLRDDPEVREMIAADKQRRQESIGLLAARVHALADYRDRLVRLGMTAVRENNTTKRAMRLAADEVAIDRLQ